MQALISKSLNMATKTGKDSLGKTLAFRCWKDDEAAIIVAMGKERRTESDVSRALLRRGIAAYQRDHQLFEPDEAEYKPAAVINTAPERKKTTGVQKKTGTGNR